MSCKDSDSSHRKRRVLNRPFWSTGPEVRKSLGGSAGQAGVDAEEDAVWALGAVSCVGDETGVKRRLSAFSGCFASACRARLRVLHSSPSIRVPTRWSTGIRAMKDDQELAWVDVGEVKPVKALYFRICGPG